MSLYAIGDIQGCFEPLERLLNTIEFNPSSDRVWFTGDLVNRGPKSLETLRLIKNLGDSAQVVLGNHDLHLLACYYGKGQIHKSDTLESILSAKDCDDLLDWLRRRPLLYCEDQYCLVHAGLAPQWDLNLAQSCAQKVEKVLRDKEEIHTFFDHMYGNKPTLWNDQMDKWAEIRFITNAFTRMRYCSTTGEIDTAFKGSPGSQPFNLVPWFEYSDRKTRDMNIIFGHWSSLGAQEKDGIYSLDSGCVWGGQLTALKIDAHEPKFIQVSCNCQ